ncbi:hypothetical protein NicSoilE8_27270 [Arthrobacter sp. NicSoilE8]|nr:hypothetical protein NicSoilE8_27270 [Arthrobacter sp. NicSoilE8]
MPITNITLVRDDPDSINQRLQDEQQVSERLREVEIAAHMWQTRQMGKWLARPIGPKVTHGDDTHRVICAIQVIREQVPVYSIGKLARKAGIARSTLTDRLNGTSVLTATDVFLVARAMDVSAADIFELAAKGGERQQCHPEGLTVIE